MATQKTQRKQAILTQKDINIVIRILKNNWWIPVLILPVFYLIGNFYVYRLVEVYKASTEFLVKTNDTYYQNNVLTDANFYNYGTYVDNLNEKRVLESYDLSNQVVNKLLPRLQVSYFIVGKVRTTEQFDGMPFRVKVYSLNPSFYERSFDFRVVDYKTYKINFDFNGTKEELTGTFDSDLITADFGLKIERVGAFSNKTVEGFKQIFYQFSVHSQNYLIASIRSNLKVVNPDYTNILKIELKDIIPQRAVLILDTLTSVYSQNKLKTKLDLNDRTISYIDIQLDQISSSLKNIEDTMQNYKEQKAIINLDWEQTDFLSKISKYDGEKSILQVQLRALKDLEEYILEGRDPQFLPPSVFVSEKGGFMNKAVGELYDKQIELNKLGSIYKGENPSMKELEQSIRKTKQDLLVYINNTRAANIKQIENIESELRAYKLQAKQIPEKLREIVNIQRKATVNEQLYNFLLEKKASTRIARASIVPDMKVVEAPRNIGVDSPDKPKIRNQFVFGGLLLSMILILVRVLLYTRIKSIEHLKELTTLPVIGVLPAIKVEESESVIVDQTPNSTIAEAFRNVRTNLQYASVDINAKSYLITSYLPGEGKTFTTVNLAATLAASGKRTIILELDLHKPRVYKRMNVPKQEKGIATYITGQSTYEEIISPTHIPNLYCIYSGPVPPNPSEMALSERMKELILRVKKDFDYVFIDTPPAGLLSDSVYLIQFVDSSIFVLNAKTSTKRVINFIETIIENNNIQNLLLLLNGASRAKRKYYYQGYGYSYGYGYGYGYGRGYGYGKGYGKGLTKK